MPERPMHGLSKALRRLAQGALLASALVLGPARAEDTRVVRLAADDWCPQHCEGEAVNRGYVVELVEQAFAHEHYRVQVTYLPWLRAMAEVKRGAYDGLLTPTVSGYPDFFFHEAGVGKQQYCFYTRKDASFRYQAPESLLGQRVSYLKNSGLGALEPFLRKHRRDIEIVEFASGRDFVLQLFEFLRLERTDIIVMSSDAYRYALKRRVIPDAFREAGCLAEEKLAVGFSRHDPARAQELAAALDRGLASLATAGRVRDIMSKYGMPVP